MRDRRLGRVAGLVVGALVGAHGAVALAAGAAPTRPAAEAAPAPHATKVAVLDVQASGPVDNKQIQGLSQLVASLIAGQPSLQVLTSSDIRTMLGFEAEKKLLGCSDSHCLAQIGGALGVEFVVAPEISRVGRTWLVTVVLLDVENARAVARKTGTAPSEDALVDVTTRVTRQILPALTGGKVVAASPVAAAPAAATEVHRGGRGALAWTLTGVGGAAALSGAAMLVYAWATYGRYQASLGGAPVMTKADADTAGNLGRVGASLAALGAVLVAGSFLVPHPGPAPQAPPGPAVGVAVLPGGAYAEVTVPLGGPR